MIFSQQHPSPWLTEYLIPPLIMAREVGGGWRLWSATAAVTADHFEARGQDVRGYLLS